MPNLIDTLLGAPGAAANAINATVNTAAEAAKAAINHFLPDPVEQQKAKAAIDQAVRDADYRDASLGMSAIVAEANSSDKWTSRARPGFLYVMYVMILASIPMGLLSAFNPEMAVQIADGMKAWLAAIPEAMWGMMGVGYVGYVAGRSYDKKQALLHG